MHHKVVIEKHRITVYEFDDTGKTRCRYFSPKTGKEFCQKLFRTQFGSIGWPENCVTENSKRYWDRRPRYIWQNAPLVVPAGTVTVKQSPGLIRR